MKRRKSCGLGDAVTLALGYQEMRGDLANSPGMDDKTGLWVCLEALRRAHGQSLNVSLYAVSTVQEEIGLRGAATSAFGIDPHAGIAVDVTHATDCPTIEKKQEGDVKLGGGPVIYRGPNMNPVVVERLLAACDRGDIPYQMGALGRGSPTDANAIQITRAGVAAGLVSIPNRYMHSAVEMISLDDIDRTADLLAQFAIGLKADTDFTPVVGHGHSSSDDQIWSSRLFALACGYRLIVTGRSAHPTGCDGQECPSYLALAGRCFDLMPCVTYIRLASVSPCAAGPHRVQR